VQILKTGAVSSRTLSFWYG